jgi:hypothetical protein
MNRFISSAQFEQILNDIIGTVSQLSFRDNFDSE